MRILLVDDSAKHRRSGKCDLLALGHEVIALSSYWDAHEVARREHFDVALIDLLMPAEGTTLSPQAEAEHLGREIDAGFPLLLWLACCGVPRIAIVTDTNHHDHPHSAVVDWFGHHTHDLGSTRFAVLHAHLKEDGAKDYQRALASLG